MNGITMVYRSHINGTEVASIARQITFFVVTFALPHPFFRVCGVCSIERQLHKNTLEKIMKRVAKFRSATQSDTMEIGWNTETAKSV